jgi:hypothetical protein
MSSLSLHLTYRANPNVLINNNFRTFSGETGCFCHTIGKNKIILQLSKVLTYTYILLTFFFFVSTTLHAFEYQTIPLEWKQKEVQIFH